MTTYATVDDVRHHFASSFSNRIPSRRPSLVVPSGAINPAWLMGVLPPPWFVGAYEPDFAMMPRDCRPRLVDWMGQDRTGGLS
jgi:hypothetical protein